MEKEKRIIERHGRRYFYRLSEMDRKHHNLMFLLMFVLFLTGFPQRFYGEWWASRVYPLVGGARFAPTIHRFAGLALAGLFILHILSVVRNFIVRRLPRLRDGLTFKKIIKELLAMEMVPNSKDAREFIHHILYLLYLKKSPPEYGRMTWREKMDYLALYRGIPFIAVTGILLWQADIAASFIPGIVLNIAHIVHSYEVTLILLSVVGFHWYNVHYSPDKFPMSHAFITGYIPEDEMVREHYDEYRDSMKEAGGGGEIRKADDIGMPCFLERVGYKLFTLLLLLFFVWFAAIAARYIFYVPSPLDVVAAKALFEDIPAGTDRLSGCVHCHTDVPHAESNETMEPFLNMHSSFLACETCHKKGREVVFRWYDPVSEKGVDNPSAGQFAGKRGDYGVKIACGAIENGRFIPFKVAPEEGEMLNKKNHRELSKEPLGCSDCHKKEGGYLPLGELGYPVERISEINGAERLSVIEKYRNMMEEAGH